MKKIIIALIVAAIALTLSISAFAYFNSDEYVFSNSIADSVSEIGEREEIEPILNILKKGSIAFDVSSTEKSDFNVSAAGKLYFSKDAIMLDGAEIKVDDKKLDLGLYLSKDQAYVENQSILNGTYGLEFNGTADDFEDSIFAYGEDGKYAIQDKEIYDAIVDILKASEDQKDNKKIAKDAQGLLEKYSKKAYKLICKYGEIDSDTDKINTGDDKNVSVKEIVLTLDGEAIAEVLSELYDQARDDKDLEELIEKLSDKIGEFDTAEDSDEPKTLLEAYNQYFVDDEEDYISNAIDALEDSDAEIEITAYTSKISHTLMQVSLEYTNGTYSNKFSLDFGKKGIKDTEIITFTSSSGTYEYEIVYEITENNKKEFKATLDIDEDFKIKLNIDKKNEKYKVFFGDYTLSGKYEQSGDKTTITASSLKDYLGEDILPFKISLTFDEKDKMPKPEENVESIFDIKESDIDKWIENAEEFFAKTKPSTDADAAYTALSLNGLTAVKDDELIPSTLQAIGIANISCVVSASGTIDGNETIITIFYFDTEADAELAEEQLRAHVESENENATSSSEWEFKREANMIWYGTTGAAALAN